MAIQDLSELTRPSPATLLKIAQRDYYYYDNHPTREDLMGETIAHFDLIHYLVDVLEVKYRGKDCLIVGNFNTYQTPDVKEYPLAPDVAVIKGVTVSEEERRQLRSWKMLLPNHPAPAVVFEISSDETGKDDLERKPVEYQLLGVKEYFAYDPMDNPPAWGKRRNKKLGRLQGWRYVEGDILRIEPNDQGWLWSSELECWLVPDGRYLRLYDPEGHLLPTKAEAIAQREAEERAAKEAEQAAKEKAWAKLRELGIDPEKL